VRVLWKACENAPFGSATHWNMPSLRARKNMGQVSTAEVRPLATLFLRIEILRLFTLLAKTRLHRIIAGAVGLPIGTSSPGTLTPALALCPACTTPDCLDNYFAFHLITLTGTCLHHNVSVVQTRVHLTSLKPSRVHHPRVPAKIHYYIATYM
jgi:hypothetical protein